MGQILTVLGPISPAALGFTLPHEHLFVDLFSWPGGKSSSGALGIFDPVMDWDMMVSELEAYREAGGRTVVELSLREIGRNPESLKRLSEAAKVNIIMGCGWYRDSFLPVEINYRSADELAEELVGEFRDGVDTTGVRPGIIGEIGVEQAYPTAREERVLRAAARAHLRTGLAITTHTPIRTSGLHALAILRQEGVPPDRVIIGHADSYPVKEYLLALLQHGCYVQFDCIAWTYRSRFDMPYSPDQIADLTVDLIRLGHGNRILLSHDICHRAILRHYGGDGFTCLAEKFLPLLRQKGAAEEAIRQITVENNARVLAY
ncbi:MAG TPA: hypothetical protein VGL91_01655 [Acidobacteriota bacterium]|jgi:phosphotriesterase-related protein